jgi:hypothetical protein
VVDSDLMGAVDDGTEHMNAALQRLSRDFGEAQYFVNYRVSSGYGWVRARSGKVERAWVYFDGEQLWKAGPITKEEVALDVDYAPRPFPPGKRKMPRETVDQYIPDEDDVVKVAGAWSINPETLDESIVTNPTGVLAQLPKPLH